MLIIYLDQTCSFVCELVTDTILCLKEQKKYYDVVFWISYYKCSIVEITAIGDHIRTHWYTQSLTV